jgi:O-antigen/teichoic acid export membrane protein
MTRVLISVGVIQVFIILTGMVRAKILSMVLGPTGFGIIATIDQIVLTIEQVASTMGETQAGLLQALFGMALALGAISGPPNILYLTPILNRNISNKEKFRKAHEFHELMILIIFMISLPFLLFPNLTITILYSSEFRPESDYVYLFIFWQTMRVIVNVYRQLLVGLDDVKFSPSVHWPPTLSPLWLPLT